MLLLFSGCSLTPSGDDPPPPPDNLTAKEVIQKAGPSVVSIKAGNSLGSGVIYSKEGYIVTNDHVISGADGDSYVVQLADKRTYKAELIGTDSRMDLAVLKIDAKDLQAVTFGDSSKVEKGDPVIAIGNAKGIQDSTTQGIISNVDVDVNDGTNIKKVLQTDAAVNHGNSGGALLNMRAEVIGINEMGLSNAESINWAIPSNDAKKIIDQLIEQGYVSWPYLGVEVKAMKHPKYGTVLYISNVKSGSPADKNGIRVGEFIYKVNTVDFPNVAELRKQINNTDISKGEELAIYLVRFDRQGNIIKNSGHNEEVPLEALPKGYHTADWT